MAIGLAVALTAGAAGCKVAPTTQSALMKQTDVTLTVDQQQLRVRVRGMNGPLTDIIQFTADTIMAESPDLLIKREALIWKLDAVPAMSDAIFRPDPLAAILDAWAMSFQLIDYFETGRGRELFGRWADTALLASRRLEHTIASEGKRLVDGGDISHGRNAISGWAAEHPIEQYVVGRTTVMAGLSDLVKSSKMSGMRMIGDLAVSFDDLSMRLDVYADQMLDQWRWEVELITLDLMIDHDTGSTLDRLPELLDATQAALATVERMPQTIAGEREAALDEFAVQLIELTKFVSEQRLHTLEYLSEERLEILREIDQVRIKTIDTLTAELQATREVLQAERAATMVEAEELVGGAIDHAIDRAFLRAAQLVAVTVAVLLLAGAVALFVLRRRA